MSEKIFNIIVLAVICGGIIMALYVTSKKPKKKDSGDLARHMRKEKEKTGIAAKRRKGRKEKDVRA